ncbi:putative membrane protein [Janthinobacterium sp. HH01]|uniref:hypothetical protein n=1 Tax=Janthinobacterium sp. HH01 TaxID=1198452 RepID=UPI0002AE8934|nr:hypothetical protein [Janthinobacterium sp. HH01]ELX09619.1 putative membrane protein [Janthinobacterium sp. HH01]
MNNDVNNVPLDPAAVPAAKRVLDKTINDERARLMAACRSKYLRHYVMRRLTLIGIVYFSLYGALLALLKFWPEAVKGLLIKNAAQCCSLDAVGILSPYVHVGIALLLLLFSSSIGNKAKVEKKKDQPSQQSTPEETAEKRRKSVQEAFVVAAILAFVSLVVLLPGEDETVILLRALNAFVLMITGLFFNNLFGYTRAMARCRFYASKLEYLLISEGANNTKAESFCAIMLEYGADEYRDVVGDTFLVLDTLKAKLGK